MSVAAVRRHWATEGLPELRRLYSGLDAELSNSWAWLAGERLHVHLHGEPLTAVTAVGENPLQSLADDAARLLTSVGVREVTPNLSRRKPAAIPMSQSVRHPRDYDPETWPGRQRKSERALQAVVDRAVNDSNRSELEGALAHLAVAAVGFEGVWLVTDEDELPGRVGRIPGLGAQLRLAAMAASNKNGTSHVSVDKSLYGGLVPVLHE